MRASSLSPGHRFVVIGCGSPVSIPWFKSVTNYDMEMYADTSKKVFDSLSLRHGFGAGMGNMTYWELLSGFLWSISRIMWWWWWWCCPMYPPGLFQPAIAESRDDEC